MRSRRPDGTERGWGAAGVGLVASFIGGLFVAQAGGSDREAFLSVGFALLACGLLGILIGGVAIGIQLARD
jgi:hypothetical protein